MHLSSNAHIARLNRGLTTYTRAQSASEAGDGSSLAIRGPRVFGCRPGSPISIHLKAFGAPRARWSAEGLPLGVELDPITGELRGRVLEAEANNITIRVEDENSLDEESIWLIIGDAIALTPPMGWNSWNCWGKTVDDAKIRAAARHLATSGLAAHGWTYVNIDDGWQGERCSRTGALQSNEKFPDMKGLCDYVHSLGLKVGIYSTPWKTSYAGFPGGSTDVPVEHGQAIPSLVTSDKFGTRSYHAEDVRQFVEWGIDYLKYDWYPISVEHTEVMSRELRNCGRDIIFSLSNSAPFELAAEWARLAECWRTTGDIHDCWITPPDPKPWEHSVTEIGAAQDAWGPFAKPGHWNDADMLVVGKLGWGAELRDSRLTLAERRSHMSLWCLLSSPLLLGCDLSQLDDETLSLLTNDEVLAINQDAAGVQARLRQRFGNIEIWHKPLFDGAYAVGVFNQGPEAVEFSLAAVLTSLKASDDVLIRDVWQKCCLDATDGDYSLCLESHDVSLLRVDL